MVTIVQEVEGVLYTFIFKMYNKKLYIISGNVVKRLDLHDYFYLKGKKEILDYHEEYFSQKECVETFLTQLEEAEELGIDEVNKSL